MANHKGRGIDTWREAGCLSVPAPAFAWTEYSCIMRTVLFCSHKGGSGKTSLLSHTVSQYAQSHPDRKVLLIDCSIPADVTRQVLGGDHDFKGEENFDTVSVTQACCPSAVVQHLQVTRAAMQVLELQPKRTATALFERCVAAGLQHKPASSRSWSLIGRNREPDTKPAGVVVDIESYIVRVADYNPAVPSNVYLAAGGPGNTDIVSFTADQQQTAAQNLQQSLASLAVYDVFFDTDGDLSFSDYTRIALLVGSGLIVVPSEASFLDYNRLLTFCEVSTALACVNEKSCSKLAILVLALLRLRTA